MRVKDRVKKKAEFLAGITESTDAPITQKQIVKGSPHDLFKIIR